MVGKTLLHYRILKEVGKGGMGVVYKAEDTRLHRVVAIKALAVDLVGDEKARTRFLREARAASSIDHPNICTVYEINEAEGVLFFVMQYIEGKTLKKYVGGKPLELDQALDLSLQLADALAEAHRRNVLHRDIKSSNIIINERGQPKILDFGLAKLINPVESSEDLLGGGDLTQMGSPFGTASYMSPEQARGEKADKRSDVFSLGIVIYEMVTGRLPFKGKSSVDVMHSVMHDDPPPFIDAGTPGLQLIVFRALAKKPDDRYQSADMLLEELRALVRNHYSDRGTVPVDRVASLKASKTEAKKGVVASISGWLRRALGQEKLRSEESSAGSGSATPDVTPSMWQSRDKKAIAILPFKNLSGSPENDFYSFSLADSVITELAQLRDLIVRPSSYIAQYQNREVDPRAVGAQLAVDAVLVGGYIKSGDRFRVTPQLVDTNSGEIVWSEKIDVDSRDIITVQDTITRQIVDGLRVRTSSTEQERMVRGPTTDAEAYESYLKGRTLLYKFIIQTLDLADIQASVECFNKAIELDPEFGLAHSGLGVAYLNYVLKGIEGIEYYALAKAAFDRALRIDPKLIEPRVRMIYIDLVEGRSQVARDNLESLLRQAPNEPSVHSAAAYVYRLSGQYDRALEAWNRFLELNPTEVVFASYNRARIHGYRGDYESAQAEIARGLAFEPNHPLLWAYGAMIDYLTGNLDEAAKRLEEVLAKHPELHSYKLFLSLCYYRRGDRERAFELIDDRVIASARADQDVAYWLATMYAVDRRTDDALEWLERAIMMGNENYPWLSIDPNWEPIREDPRYIKIMDSLKMRWERLVGVSST